MEGVLSVIINQEKEENSRRLPVITGMHSITASTFKQQAYDMIKNAILYRRLQVGEIYSQDAICNELKISRTPVREALLELQKEGYITFMRGRGISVIPVTRQDAADIIEMRYHMEIIGSRLAAERRTSEQLFAMAEVLREMESFPPDADGSRMYMLDREFHRRLFVAAHNNWLLSDIERLRDQFLRVESQDAFDEPERCRQVCREHRQVLAAIQAQDVDQAGEAMRDHLDRTYTRTIEQVMRAAEE